MQAVTVLGATGSIGQNTLDVIARHPDRFEVFALSAATQVEPMVELCRRFRPRHAVMAQAQAAFALTQRLRDEGVGTEVHTGEAALCAVSEHPEVHVVMAAIVGAAGLAPALAAAKAGKKTPARQQGSARGRR